MRNQNKTSSKTQQTHTHTHTHGAALIDANLVAQIIEKKTEGLHRRWDSKVSNKK